MTSHRETWHRPLSAVLLLSALLGGNGQTGAQEPKKEAKPEASARPAFRDADAVRVLDELRQALESNSGSRLLKLFDARRMPGYGAFRDQIAEFLERYDAFQVDYHVTQVTVDGEFGAMLAEVVLEATPGDGTTPKVRRQVPARLVVAWNGKSWKIADFAPRSLFR